MKISKHLLATIVTLPLLFGSMSAFAKKHEHGNGIKFLLKGVELTEPQKKQMKDINVQLRQESRSKKKTRMLNNVEVHKQMNDLMLYGKFNEAEARAISQKIANEQAEDRVERLRRQHQLFSVLTPEQKLKVEANMNEATKKMQERMKNNPKRKQED